MGILDSLKASGFKAEKSTEGEYKALVGTYKVAFVVADKMPANDKGGESLKVEFKVVETVEGSPSYSKFNEFKKFLALEGEKVADKKKGVPFIINALFTAGYEVSGETDEAILESIKAALGTELYIKAYGWTPEDSDKERQMFNFMKESVAMKKAGKAEARF